MKNYLIDLSRDLLCLQINEFFLIVSGRQFYKKHYLETCNDYCKPKRDNAWSIKDNQF